jgi:hypothetical protein
METEDSAELLVMITTLALNLVRQRKRRKGSSHPWPNSQELAAQ